MLHAVDVGDHYFPGVIVEEAIARFDGKGTLEEAITRRWERHYVGDFVQVTFEEEAFIARADIVGVPRFVRVAQLDATVHQRALTAAQHQED